MFIFWEEWRIFLLEFQIIWIRLRVKFSEILEEKYSRISPEIRILSVEIGKSPKESYDVLYQRDSVNGPDFNGNAPGYIFGGKEIGDSFDFKWSRFVAFQKLKDEKKYLNVGIIIKYCP